MGGGTQATYLSVLEETIAILESAGIDYLLIGGVASSAYVIPNWDPSGSDIDVLVHPRDADRSLEAFDRAGFATQKKDPAWIFKASRPDVTVDIIFRPSGDIELDDEMKERSRTEKFKGIKVKVPCPEDLIVLKVVAHDEESDGHWHDSLRMLARYETDWSYLTDRALRHGPYRLASFLYYALSLGIAVDKKSLTDLVSRIPEEGGPG